MMGAANGRRVALVAGCRTPFCRSGSDLKDLTAVDLARHATVELLHRANLDGEQVDEMFFGQVVASPLAPNLAREVSLLPQFPRTIPAVTVNRACASANTAIAYAHDQIALGHARVAIAGGAESLSDIPVLHSRRFADTLVNLSRAKTLGQRLALIARIRPRDLIPVAPAIAEPSTGETMGQSAERMAKENGITRAAQDALALRSHQRALAGTQDGRLTAEIAPMFGAGGTPVVQDNGVRADTTAEKLAALKPVFDRRYGTVTAGNSSPLTDGGAAVLLMSDESASALGYEPLAFIRSYAVTAVDPAEQLLMGPAYAVPLALERAGIPWREVGLIEMHEAFAAQVLSNVQAFESREWAERHLGRSEPIGEVNWDIVNVMGGSIAIGHPFGATGARLTLTLANEMRRRNVQFGLISVCAQGGMGFAMVLERR
ncbi:MAG TPA: acetyl-CoA C-acyltransferase [Gemmatimonadales bacterium]|nr:acetyl-CoA C-acyltransferase [Gemmatimonadales bacterium]